MKNLFLLSLLMLFFGACTTPPIEKFSNVKNLQTFLIDAKEPNTIIGKNGTLLYLPKGAFMQNGQVIEAGEISVELSEALDGMSLVENNLSTNTKDGKMLESVGMIYFNAKANGEDLDLNPKQQSTARIPSSSVKDNVQAFTGTASESGAIVWKAPEPMESKPTLVALSQLNFGCVETSRRQPQGYNDQNVKRILIQEPRYQDLYSESCGLCANLVKVLSEKKFENTLISTIEFEERMQFIHKACSEDVLKIYIGNLNKNLWEIDEMAANLLDKAENPQAKTFRNFAKLKLTKPDGLSPISPEDMRRAIKKAEAIQKSNADLKIAYTVNMSKMGWINCDCFMGQENTILAQLSIELKNVPQGSKPKVKLIFSSVKSALTLENNKTGAFYLGFNESNPGMQVPLNEEVLIVAHSMVGETAYVGTQKVILGKEENISLALEEKPLMELKELIESYFAPKEGDKISKENASDYACCIEESDGKH